MTAEKILVVEDSPTVIGVIETFLRRKGYQVYTARDGLTALTTIRSFNLSLVLLDIILPFMDGIKLCAVIRENEKLDSLPIVMMTALSDRHYRQRAREVGANGFIKKPFHEDVLIDTIERYLRKPRASMNMFDQKRDDGGLAPATDLYL